MISSCWKVGVRNRQCFQDEIGNLKAQIDIYLQFYEEVRELFELARRFRRQQLLKDRCTLIWWKTENSRCRTNSTPKQVFFQSICVSVLCLRLATHSISSILLLLPFLLPILLPLMRIRFVLCILLRILHILLCIVFVFCYVFYIFCYIFCVFGFCRLIIARVWNFDDFFVF